MLQKYFFLARDGNPCRNLQLDNTQSERFLYTHTQSFTQLVSSSNFFSWTRKPCRKWWKVLRVRVMNDSKDTMSSRLLQNLWIWVHRDGGNMNKVYTGQSKHGHSTERGSWTWSPTPNEEAISRWLSFVHFLCGFTGLISQTIE